MQNLKDVVKTQAENSISGNSKPANVLKIAQWKAALNQAKEFSKKYLRRNSKYLQHLEVFQKYLVFKVNTK